MAGAFEPDSVIPFAPAAKNGAPPSADQLDKQGKPFLGSFTRPLVLPSQTVSVPSNWPRSFPISFGRRKSDRGTRG